MLNLAKQWISALEYEMLCNGNTWVVVLDYVGLFQLSVEAFGVYLYLGYSENQEGGSC
jgi:hypothetical protein